MTEAVMERRGVLLEAVRDAIQKRPTSRWPKLEDYHQEGWRDFERLGLPSLRDEDWRFTNLRPITKIDFAVGSDVGTKISLREIDRLNFSDFECQRLVFINGNFAGHLSSDEMPAGVTAANLEQLLAEDGDAVMAHLGRYASSEQRHFVALNQALMQDCGVIMAQAGTIVEKPLHLLFVNIPEAGRPHMSHPRVLVVAEDNTQVAVIESHVALGRGTYLTNAVTEIVAGANSVVDHYKLQAESGDAFHLGAVDVQQGRHANVRSMAITLSGRIIRNDVGVKLVGEGGYAELDGLYLAGEDHHIDNFTSIEHLQPHCDSREHFKGILSDSSRGVFRGRIVVAEGAQKTDSKQTNNNLLLSDSARINTKPQLEIYADDVKCTHGATIGQLDREAIFYLRTRGISQEAARSMLVYAFANELVNRIKVDVLRSHLDGHLFDWLPKGASVKDAF